MKQQILALIITGAVMSIAPSHAEPAAVPSAEYPVLAPNAETFMLENGLEVVVIPDRRAPVVTHMIWYRVGAADEAPGQSGIAHFLEHLMFKGTKKHPAGAFSARVMAIGGNQNAFTSHDYTGYFQRVAKEHLGEMMALEADRMTNLVLTDEVVAPERDVVREERRLRTENDPGSLLSEALSAALYTNHPYGRPVIGWMHEIEQLDRDTALSFYRRYYTPNNAVLVVAGDVTPDRVRELAEETYGQLPARPEAVRIDRPLEPPPVGARTVTVTDEKVREPSLRRVYIVPSSSTAENGEDVALDLLADILGGGPTSRLYDKLVRDGGKAVNSGAYYLSTGVDDTRFMIYGVPAPGVSLTELDRAITGVVRELADAGVTEEELQRAKRSVIAHSIYAQDSQATLARIFGAARMAGRTVADIQQWPTTIQAVTAEQVRQIAEKYLRPERSATGFLKPEQDIGG